LKKEAFKYLAFVIFLFAFSLRAGLAYVNNDANDDHYKVVQMMLVSKNSLSYSDCSQCYHPKLYHYTVAVFQNLLAVDSFENQMRLGQFINVFAGMLLLLIILNFIKKQDWKPAVQLLVFALIALNPKLIDINAQYTNDTFVFTFSALAVLGVYYFGHVEMTGNWVRRLGPFAGSLNVIVIMVGCLGAALSKGSGIPLTFAIVVFLGVLYFITREKSLIFPLGSLPIIFIFVVPIYGNYVANYNESKQILGLNGTKSPPPQFFKKTDDSRPGVQSVASAYFTFRYIDLLKNPFIVNESDGYAINRTSVWTQVYARTFSARFDQWPKKWINTDKSVLNTTRALIILGLIPSLFFIYGLALSLKQFFTAIMHGKIDGDFQTNFLMLLILGAMITMLLKLTFEHRDFCTMKAIYLWPGLLAIIYFLGVGMNRISNNKISTGLNIFVLGISVVSIFEIISLIAFLR